MARRRRYDNRYNSFGGDDDNDPRSFLLNLFDAAMVFAVGLMVAFVVQSKMTEFLTDEDVTYVKNAGQPDMEIIVKKENKVTRYKADPSKESGTGKGKRIGVAYRLENGEVYYIPEVSEMSESKDEN